MQAQWEEFAEQGRGQGLTLGEATKDQRNSSQRGNRKTRWVGAPAPWGCQGKGMVKGFR